MVVSAGVGGSSVGVLGVVEVLQGGGGDPPVQGLESLLDGGVLQDLHLPGQQTLQLHLADKRVVSNILVQNGGGGTISTNWTSKLVSPGVTLGSSDLSSGVTQAAILTENARGSEGACGTCLPHN